MLYSKLLVIVSFILIQAVLGYSADLKLMDASVKLEGKESFQVLLFTEDMTTNTNSSKKQVITVNSSVPGLKCYLVPVETYDKLGDLNKYDFKSVYPGRIISIFDTYSPDIQKTMKMIVLTNTLLSNKLLVNNGLFYPVNYYKYLAIETNISKTNVVVTNYNESEVLSIKTNSLMVTNIGANSSKRKIYITLRDFGPVKPDYMKSSKSKEEINTILQNKYTDLIESKNFCYKVFEDSKKLYSEKYYDVGNESIQFLLDNYQPGINDTYSKNKDNPFKQNNCYYFLGLNNLKLYNNTSQVENLSNALVYFKKALGNDDFDSQMVNLKYQQFSELMVNVIMNSFSVLDGTYSETNYNFIFFDSEHFENYDEF